MREFLISISWFFNIFFFVYFAFINFIYLLLLFLSIIKSYSRNRDLKRENFNHLLKSNFLPEISFLVPAYNEADQIIPSIESLVNLSYRYKQIIVINDGSTDSTFDSLYEKYQLLPIPHEHNDMLKTAPIRGVYRSIVHPEVIVIDKVNGKKHDALNSALNICKNPYFITVDADTLIDNKYFEALIRPILASPNTIAIGAGVRLKNGCEFDYNRIKTDKFPPSFIIATQAIEYLRAFLMRLGWDYIGGNVVLSGAYSVISTERARQCGGFAPTAGDDMEIILRLNRVMHLLHIPYQIIYMPDPVAWTDGPWTVKELRGQRIRWQRGSMEAIWFNKSMLFNPKFGAFGLFSFTFLAFCETLEPIIEILGLIYIIVGFIFGTVNIYYVLILFAIVFGFTFIFTVFSLFIEELTFKSYSLKSAMKLLMYGLLENSVYRYMNLFWKLEGCWSFVKRFSEIEKDSKMLNSYIKNHIKKD